MAKKKARKTGRHPKKGAPTRAAMADMAKRGKLYKKTKRGKRSKGKGRVGKKR